MVTAIVIPIICFYFYFLTKKEMKFFHEKWKNLDHVYEEAVITGEITQINEERQRFYYHRYVHSVQITLKTTNGQIDAKKFIPIKTGYQIPEVHIGEFVRVYGNWENRQFQISRIQKV